MTDESIFTSRVAEAVTAMRKANPVTQCLTNIVVTNFTANVLLAAGASPAMVDNAQESGIFAQVAGGVLVNSGTPYPETAEAMKQAAGTAAGKWVLDPVACTLPWRGQIVRDCLAASHPAIIRGNASEILALHGTGKGARGTDAVDTTEAAL
ncbi:MAG: hydroxyethylthiazole kinase, partial [Cutibacterium granulosum]|nr:hydroxyethylthiazole kinase [Cutibacterium granulosum]